MSSKEELKHASARGVAWSFLLNLASRLLSLVVMAVQGRMLEPSAFGAFAAALAVQGFAELVIDQGFGGFITQTPKLEDDHLHTAFWFNAAIGILVTAAIMLLAKPVATGLAHDESVTAIVRWVSLTLLFRTFATVPTALLVREMKFRSLSMRSLIAATVGGVIGIVSALMGAGIYSLVLQLLVGDFVATAILWGATSWRPKPRFSWARLRELIAFSAPLIGAVLLMFTNRQLDAMLVLGTLGVAMTGIYTIGKRISVIVNQLLNKPTAEVSFSAFSRVALEEDRRRAFYRVIEFTAVVCFPIYVGIAIVAQPLIVSMFGMKWFESADSLTMFALVGLPFSLSFIHQSAIKATARTRYLMIIQLIFLPVYLPLMYVMVSYGPAWAAAAYLVASILITPVEIAFVISALSLRAADYMKALAGPSLATLLMAGATVAVAIATRSFPNLIRLGLESAVGGGVYLAALRVLAPKTFRRAWELVMLTLGRRKKLASST